MQVLRLRQYDVSECGADGYPLAWHGWDVTERPHKPPIKDLVREQAGHRCVRCNHPYRSGEHGNGEWSPCDGWCAHGGPYRFLDPAAGWIDQPGNNGWVAGVIGEFKAEARWRMLTVHHLTGDKADCRWWNLAALCQRCHLTIQGKVRMEQVYTFPHSEWFKPYAAGYYAAMYLGEDLTREETVARMDELLALEAA